VPDHYDDGGFSGGNMERPGIKALLAAIDAGLVDVIVVYKVDRLTRSLADFAKIVERLDARQASFISVTQAFNTKTSMGRLERHIVTKLLELLDDEHALRRLSGAEDAGQLRSMFATACLLCDRLRVSASASEAIRSLVLGVRIGSSSIDLELAPSAVGFITEELWLWSIPRPSPRPFREAKIRIDATSGTSVGEHDFLQLLAEAQSAKALVMANPELSLNQLGKREGRCRTHLSRLLRIAWLSPRIVDAIASGTQPKALNRHVLLTASLPIDWSGQERMFGLAT